MGRGEGRGDVEIAPLRAAKKKVVGGERPQTYECEGRVGKGGGERRGKMRQILQFSQ